MLKFSFFILFVFSAVHFINLISRGLSNPAGHWRDDLIGQYNDSLPGLSSIKVHARTRENWFNFWFCELWHKNAK